MAKFRRDTLELIPSPLQAKQYYDLLTGAGLEVRFSEQQGEDHFSLVEKLKDEEYSLSREVIDFMK